MLVTSVLMIAVYSLFTILVSSHHELERTYSPLEVLLHAAELSSVIWAVSVSSELELELDLEPSTVVLDHSGFSEEESIVLSHALSVSVLELPLLDPVRYHRTGTELDTWLVVTVDGVFCAILVLFWRVT